jgi:thioredoxin-dependent adenylylsulfate APS reductase
VIETLPDLEAATAEHVVAWGLETFGDRLALCTSFQAEGMVLLDMAVRFRPEVRVFTVDTGRLPQQTYDLMQEVRQRYGVRVEMVLPDSGEVEEMTSRHGPNLFYDAAAKRMLCCQIRKVRPLERKLRTLEAWITGLRRSQNESRAGVRKVELDDAHGSIVKLNPLADWSAEQVEDYLRRHDVPRHALYAQGYTSIGCAPCTRPPLPGAGPRSGRWWWETDAQKECGIHFSADGHIQRDVDVLLEEILRVR